MTKILVVDDEKPVCDLLEAMLQKEKYNVKTTQNPTQVMELMENFTPQIILLDIRMPQIDGLSLLSQIKEKYPTTIVILITAYASLESAIIAIRRGAFDYITKPFKLEEIRLVIDKAIETHKLKEENLKLKKEIEELKITETLIGASKKFNNILDLIKRVSQIDSTVLIQGESGTGKELVAREIHRLSPRANNPFIAINCGALPESLLESELFGYIKGAFTGAIKDKNGLFKAANHGTLFLDEISAASLKIQIDLLRVIERREIIPIGSTSAIPVDVRLITATNQNLEQLIQEGKFREDLYYRINVIPIAIPPLRERKEDIPSLIHYFLKKYCSKHKLPIKKFTPEATRLLMNYDWPGNIRELENTIEREVVLTENTIITHEDLPDKIKEASLPRPSNVILSDNEESLLSLRQKQILQYLNAHTKITSKICASLFNISQRMARYELEGLAKKALIVRKGSAKKNTFYTLA